MGVTEPPPFDTNLVPRARVTCLGVDHTVERHHRTERKLEALDRSRERDASRDGRRGPSASDVISGDRSESGRGNRGDRNEWASGQARGGHEAEARNAHRVFNGQISFNAHISQIFRI